MNVLPLWISNANPQRGCYIKKYVGKRIKLELTYLLMYDVLTYLCTTYIVCTKKVGFVVAI